MGLQDCLEAINLPALEDALKHIKAKGMPPPDLVSKEDKNEVGKVDVDAKVIDELTWKAGRWMFHDVPPIAIIDGFLMYSEDMKDIRDIFDVKIFLRTDFATAKSRREARNGYVTIEGFWEDPPNVSDVEHACGHFAANLSRVQYVENIVWPNYVKDHAFLFHNGDVEGQLKQDVVDQVGIKPQPPETQGDMTALLQWAYEVVNQALGRNFNS